MNNSAKSPLALLYLRVSTSRQATRGGEAEGYSIPAQRDACTRKVLDLGAEVAIGGEFIDAGASARSADRPALQAMLARLADRSQPPIAYVVVHKVDRLARDRADDIAIGLAIHRSGATLVSATEAVDDTPAGTLLHGIMASIAEFYSKNLAAEVKKGQKEKVLRGGTPGYTPLGYLNTVSRVDGREVRGVIIDPDRAPFIKLAYEIYSEGNHSISDLVKELAAQGFTNRPTTTRSGMPITRSQLHRILTSSYYIGKVTWAEVEYQGTQESIIDLQTYMKVQVLLSSRRHAGDRSWKHDHYLKGSLRCGQCQSLIGLSNSTGKMGDVYSYFYCIGRNKKRTQCDLPFLPVDFVEQKVAEYWKTVDFPVGMAEDVRQQVTEQIETETAASGLLLKVQKVRLGKLERARQKLIDAYLMEAITTTELKQRQDLIAAEQNDAERLISAASQDKELMMTRLDESLRLLNRAAELYVRLKDNDRRSLNQVIFEHIYLDRDGVSEAPMNPPFGAISEITGQELGHAQGPDGQEVHGNELDQKPQGHRNQTEPEGNPIGQIDRHKGRSTRRITKTNTAQKSGRCSNVTILAEEVGFEPTVSCPTHTFQACRFGRFRTPPDEPWHSVSLPAA
jgi:site-specific DNA recombinase